MLTVCLVDGIDDDDDDGDDDQWLYGPAATVPAPSQ